ncbi:hypothetical protein [Nostoc sp.]
MHSQAGVWERGKRVSDRFGLLPNSDRIYYSRFKVIEVQCFGLQTR